MIHAWGKFILICEIMMFDEFILYYFYIFIHFGN